ncbi:DUF4886 domain-containing protein [Parabacteroides sp. FAFU027]|uniref:DUF4886 domain-containing protein n=1 Tax=Parabacteroides sp. FAFU027 TaxID=2922715 RepID=UPI001FAFAC4B|nr:DUF4886 domain-containing protein [Parabacteroides sp. FAFU027]
MKNADSRRIGIFTINKKDDTMNNKRLKHFFLILFFAFAVQAYSQKTIRILAIGNSFSEDAAESYVDDLAKADGVQLIIANLYIGGCSLETHWNNAVNNTAAYSYRKIVNGDTTRLDSKTLAYALADEPWDYISFQQVSQYSGRYNTYFPYLPNLMNYVKGLATNPDVQYCMHRTWAYASNSTHSEYDYYQKNQMIMYDSIVDVTSRVAALMGINIIIPAGTAIQNGRSSYIGDNFNRDGYHLTYGLGRYTAACTWYEKMLGKPVIGNTFAPKGLSASDIQIAQKAAHYAVVEPDKVTSMTQQSVGFVKSIQIDFGSQTLMSGLPWNNLTSTALGSSVSGLLDTDGNNTGVSIKVSDAFGGINSNGPSSTNTGTSLPSAATGDSFWGNGTGAYTGMTEPTAGFLVTGLEPEKAYDFCFFSSRTGATDNRETTFTVTGSNQQSVSVNSSGNTTNLATVTRIKPASDGSVSISLRAGANNNNSYKFFYINTLQISPSAQTSPVALQRIKRFRIYPNPVKDIAFVDSEQELTNMQVIDLSGRIVFDTINTQSGIISLELSRLSNGCYMLRTDAGNAIFLKR